MIAQTTLQLTALKLIMAKLLNSQSQAGEMMLYQNTMQSKTLPIKEPSEAQKGDGRRIETSLVP